jgi:FkbH-like protein
VIGEGSVEHYAERQSILRTLRQKGVLLAICSKNDPKNVNWLGATLSESDFVCGRINWAPKVANIRQIASQLNLKTKDFIFVDDRADERELVKQALPEITVLDAESPATWNQLGVIAAIMAESAEGDRTLAYAERETRQQFLAQAAPASALAEKLGVSLGVDFDQSEEAALSGLELQLSLRSAGQKDLKRVSELVNRTNQFNLCGSRTTLREVTQWHRSERHAIVVAEARDKFGAMGIISVAVLEETGRGVEIPVFVLSCRVFGYGMETALLNCIRRWRPGRTVYGHFRETPHNQPCHNVYPQNGFAWEGNVWRSTEAKETRDPPWLVVDSRQFASAP